MEKSEESEERNIMLEYYPKGHHFHYNTGNHPIPDEYGCYLPLGWCSMKEAERFCRLVQPFISESRIDSPIVSFDTMKESWDNYCDLIEKGKL